GIEILGELHAVTPPELAAQLHDLLSDTVEDAAILLAARRALPDGVAAAEQPLEDEAWTCFRRQRRRRRLPRHRVHVRARVAVIAGADDVVAVEGDLERRELRIAADLLRDQLIDRRAGLDVGAFGLLRMHAAHERRRGARVLATRI